MIAIGSDYPLEKYSDYKNRTITKNIDKFKNQLNGIKQNSLSQKDKKTLMVKMLEILKEEIK